MSEVSITSEDMRKRLPAFSDSSKYPDQALEGALDTAECYVSKYNRGPLRGGCRIQAICLMAAHILKLREKMTQGNGEVGATASATVGNVSIGMIPPPNNTQYEYYMNLTGYGMEYMRLLAIFANGGVYVGGSLESVLR